MHMYKGYKTRDVMDEYAITFTCLLEEGFRRENRHNLLLARLNMAPTMKTQDWKKVMDGLEELNRLSGDILEETPEISIEKLKKVFGQS